MRVILVTGGARSGKTAYAQSRASELGGADVTVIATARPDDEEMVRRIARHRAERPSVWRTVEAPWDAAAAIRAARDGVVLLDCLTLLASNVLLRASSADQDAARAAVTAEVEALLAAAAERVGSLVVVTNEVGLGLVPASRLGRWFRDELGMANQRLGRVADEVILMVSGIPLMLKG